MNMPILPMHQAKLVAAARDTLMNIAGVCGVSALRLTPDRSLAKHLGYNNVEFFALARYQCKVGDRLRGDGRKTMIDSAELHTLCVWEVYVLTVARADGTTLEKSDSEAVIALALADLRGEES